MEDHLSLVPKGFRFGPYTFLELDCPRLKFLLWSSPSVDRPEYLSVASLSPSP